MARRARDKALEDVEETLCHKGDTLDTEGDSGTITKVVLREAMAPPRGEKEGEAGRIRSEITTFAGGRRQTSSNARK